MCSATLTGCGLFNSNEKPIQNTKPKTDKQTLHREAMNKFLDGAADEAKGNLAGAILEYQDALSYEESAGIYFAIAKNYYLLQKLSPALTNAKAAVLIDSTSIDYLMLLQDIYSAARLHDSAAIYLERIIKLDSLKTEAYFKLGFIYENSKPKQAIELYKRLMKIDGPQWPVLVRIAEVYEKLGDANGAIATLENLLSLDPENIQLQKMLLEYYSKSKSIEKATALLDELLQLYPEDDELIQKKGELLLAQGKNAEAVVFYNKLLAMPNITYDSKIKICAFVYILSTKDSSLVPTAWNMFITMDKDTTDWQIKWYLGAIAKMKNDTRSALQYFKITTELASWNAEVWTRYGGLLFDEKEYDKVIETLSEAVKKFPEEFGISMLLGISYAQKNNYIDAEPHLEKANELDANNLNAISAYAYTLSKVGKGEKAIEYLRKGIQIDSANVDLISEIGLIYDNMEKWTECDSAYLAALKLNPDNALVLNNYAYSLSKRSSRLNEALAMVDKALVKDPGSSSYLDTKGWILFKMGNFREAKRFIEESLKINNDREEVLDHLGDVEFNLGNKEEAIKQWNRALELNKSNSKIKEKIEKGIQ